MSLILKTKIMKKITILLFAITAVAAGCKKFTENINNNPNQPTVVTPNVVLSAALLGSADNLANDFQNTTRWMGYWARSGNFIETIPTETYQLDASYADGEFQALYGTMTKYDYIEHNSAGDPFYIGVSKTMKALHFSTLVDGFNNVPYSQAFNLNKYPNPKYDDAASIYTDLVLQCDSAVTYFQKAITFYSAAPKTVISIDDKYDIMYGRGNGVNPTTRMNEWIALANTIKLKILMTGRTSTAAAFSSTNIMAELAKVTATGQGYIGPNQSAAVNPGFSDAQQAQQNPFYGDFWLPSATTNNDYAFFRANEYYINYGNNSQDPRYTDFYSQLSAAPYFVGNYDGNPNSIANSGTSGIGTGTATSTTGTLKSATQDELIMSDFESLFWQAEAAQLGYITTSTAAQLAQEGTEQSFIYVNDTGSGSNAQNIADADGFLAADAGDKKTDVSVGGMQAIITLKWAALNSINWEQAYTDYRRTGYPVPDGVNFGFSHANNVVQHSMVDVTGKTQPINIPFRYLYPQSEINTNGGNIPGGTSAYTTIFWDNREK
jgi:hypothetical protein